MDGDGDPLCALHPRPRDQEAEEQQERRDEMRQREEAVIAREKASKKARKKRRRDRRRGTLELEQRPRVLPPEDPRPDYMLGWRPIRDQPQPQPQAPLYRPEYLRARVPYLREEVTEALARRRPSSSRQTGSSAPARTATRVRQSVLYSDRPRLSRRPSSNKLPVNVLAGEVSSREFEAVTLGQSPPTLDPTHRVVMHTSDVSSGALDSTIEEPSALEQELLSNECAYDTASSESDSEIIEEEKPEDESDCDLSELLRKVEQLPIYDDLMEGFIALANGFCDPPQHRLDAQAFWASRKEPTENLTQCKACTKEIVENGKEWMGEEVMLAFEKYIEGKDTFKDVEYGLDELQHQCFSVETYHENFHHYNFTVKTKKKNSADDWSSTLYFAQVREIYGRKFYHCYPLKPYDDGHCYACKNQGMDALQHPICLIGVETGSANTGSPFIYLSDDDSDFEL